MSQKPRLVLILFLASSHVSNMATQAFDGDINIDTTVNGVDILWGQQTLHGTRMLLPEQFLHADVAPLVSGTPQPDGIFNAGD